MHPHPSRSLGFLLPWLLLITVVVDGGLRYLPTELYAWRGWEVARRYRPSDDSAPFAPNVRYRTERTYGELAQLGNLPGLRQYHPETFTTDASGYRTTPPPGPGPLGPPAAIVVGSSFGVGLGVSDEQTLAAQLAALTGRPVYNAGGLFDDVSAAAVLRIARRFELAHGLVVLEWLERHDERPPLDGAPDQRDRSERLCHAVLGPRAPRGCTTLRGLVTVSPVQVLAERALRPLQNDRLLPNGYARRVVARRLVTGETALFHPDDVAAYYRHQPEEAAAAYVARFADAVAAANLDLLVVLVPHKYSVYYPLLAEPAPPALDAEPFLDRLEARLCGRGIAVVNLAAPYRALTAQIPEGHEHLYWLDDAHWNPRGIAVAAAQIQRALAAQAGAPGAAS